MHELRPLSETYYYQEIFDGKTRDNPTLRCVVCKQKASFYCVKCSGNAADTKSIVAVHHPNFAKTDASIGCLETHSHNPLDYCPGMIPIVGTKRQREERHMQKSNSECDESDTNSESLPSWWLFYSVYVYIVIVMSTILYDFTVLVTIIIRR